MTMIENEHFNCVKMVSCKATTIDNWKGYRWHRGHWGSPRGCRGVGAIRGVRDFRGCRGVRGVLQAGRDCTHRAEGV